MLEAIAPAITTRPSAPDPASELARRVRAMPRPLFAVMDGARFPDLPSLLGEHGLPRRSLFLDHSDVEVERAGGWLVSLASDVQIDRLVWLMGGRPAGVFWSCPDGEVALHRHLRTINLVVVPLPDDAGQPADGQAENNNAGAAYAAPPLKDETVLFRHYDPNIMASLLPLLDPAQFARLFGPATYIAMYAPDYGGPRRAPRPDDLPIAPSGLLRIHADQMDALEEARAHKTRRKVTAYLRDVSPATTARMDDAALAGFVEKCETSGRAYGLSTERSMGLWSYLTLESDGEIGRDPVVRRYFLDEAAHGTSDDKLRRLVDRLGKMPDRSA